MKIPIIIVVIIFIIKICFIFLRENVVSTHTRSITTLLSIYIQNKVLGTNNYISMGLPKIH